MLSIRNPSPRLLSSVFIYRRLVAAVVMMAIFGFIGIGSTRSSELALMATPLSPSEINLIWVAGDGVTSFEIWRSTEADGIYGVRANLPATVTTYTDTGLEPESQYCYLVRVVSAASANTNYTTCAQTLGADEIFSVPAFVPYFSATAASMYEIDLFWIAQNPDRAFQVWRSTQADGIYEQRVSLPAGVTAYTDSGLNPGTQYCYLVRPASGGGDNYSACASTLPSYGASAFLEPAPAPGTGPTLSINFNDARGVEIAWSGVESPAPIDPIRLAWFYRPPNDNNFDTLIEHYDTYVLTRWRTDEAMRETILESRSDVPMLQYLHFTSIHDPCRQIFNPPGTPCSCNNMTWTNNVAYRPQDICELRDNHPDWFLRDANGNFIHQGSYRETMMDIGNPGWQQFWLERAIQMQEDYGWNGVFLDNVHGSMALLRRAGITVQNYPDDASYQDATVSFLSYIREAYFEPQGVPLHGNVTEIRDNAVWFRYVEFLDGAMDEAWGVDWANRYFNVRTWEERMLRAEQTLALGRDVILVAQGNQNDLQRQQFAFASYLLINDGNASFRYGNSSTYASNWMYPNYELDLGQPLGPRYRDGDVWRRDFTNGSVMVNPAARTSQIITYDNPIELGLVIERSSDGGQTFERLVVLSDSISSFIDQDIQSGVEYCYRVRAANTRVYTNVGCATAAPPLPAAPFNMTAAAVSTTQIDVRWNDGSNNETGIILERSADGGSTFTRLTTLPANRTLFGNTGLNPDTRYCYRAFAINSGGGSGYSNVACATTQAAAASTNPSSPGAAQPGVCNPDAARDLRHDGTYINRQNVSTATIQNRSGACTYQVGMASYRKFDNIIDNQEIFNFVDGVSIAPGQTISLSVSLPTCATQIDIFFGPVLLSLNGQRYGARLLDAVHRDQPGFCGAAAQTPPPAPPAPPPPPPPPPPVVDTDGDGIPDDQDICPLNPVHDSIGDPCNQDEDGDSIPDDQDICPLNPVHDDSGDPCNQDEDGDGIPDDQDEDGDGIPDDQDICPLNPVHDDSGDPCDPDD